jgi:hypothetical protein
MVKEDIHGLGKKLKRLENKYFSENDVLNGDREDIKSFYIDLLAGGISNGRVSKCLSVLASPVKLEQPPLLTIKYRKTSVPTVSVKSHLISLFKRLI